MRLVGGVPARTLARGAILCLAIFLLARAAIAGLGGSVVPSFPTPMKVGDIKTATITITNRATTPNNTENVTVSGIFFTPSCASTDGFSCLSPDPGVFQFATVIGRVGSSCANTTFTLGPPNPATGEFELIPGKPIVLGPSNGSGPLPGMCAISINFKVLRAPRDSTPSDSNLTTAALARASLQGVATFSQGMATGGSMATITPATGNQPPVADAGPQQFAQTLTAVSLSGAGSSDPDGTIVTYQWAFGDGGTANGMNVSHVYETPGTYIATLWVTDNSGATASDTTTISILNRRPVADAGPNQSAIVQAPVTFNGTGSSDPDGTITSYAWSFGDGTSGSGANPSHAYQTTGTFTATLTVTDNSGASATDTMQVTVNPSPTGPGAYRWSSHFGGSSAAAAGYGTAQDRSGNIIVVGAFLGQVSFGGSTLASSGSTDMFIAKYKSSGEHIWSKRIGGTQEDSALSVAVDTDGNVYVAGYFKGTVDFGGGPLTAYYSGFGGQMKDAFIAKFSSTGAHLWSRKMGSFGHDLVYGIAVDSDGNVAVTGTFIGPVDFGGVTLASNSDTADVFLAKYGSTGQLLWAKKFGGGNLDHGYGVAVDPDDNIVITGAFTGSVDFGGGALQSSGAMDIVVAKYSPTGAHLWSKRFGDNAQDVGYGIATDTAGNIFVTGYFQVAVDFGGGRQLAEGAIDTFLAKFSPTGAYQWAQALGGTTADQGLGVATDVDGNCVIVGSFDGSVDFGTGPLNSAGSWDVVVAKFSPTGVPQWSKRFGGTGDDVGHAVVADANGRVTVVGTFQGTANFGGGPVTANGANDVFIVNLLP